MFICGLLLRIEMVARVFVCARLTKSESPLSYEQILPIRQQVHPTVHPSVQSINDQVLMLIKPFNDDRIYGRTVYNMFM